MIGKKLRGFTRSVRNALFDLRFGGLCGGYLRNPTPGATGTGSTDYALMPQIFGGRLTPSDTLVDVGCGTGRVINYWLSLGLGNRIYGLELMEEVAQRTRNRLRHYKTVSIVAGDAIANIPADASVFYLANPFDWAELMAKFKNRLYDLYRDKPDFKVLYFAPIHIDVFEQDPHWNVEMVELTLPPVGFFEERHRWLAVITLKK